MREYPVLSVVRVVDGDTLIVLVSLGFDVQVRATVRLARIDCPELPTVGGIAATAACARKAEGTTAIRVKGRDKYGRCLAEVVLRDGSLLSDAMVQAGHAKYVLAEAQEGIWDEPAAD